VAAARTPEHWALSAVISEQFLNALSRAGLRDGMHVEAFRQTFFVPMMGPVELSVALSITAVEFQMRAADRGRLRATVSAAGSVTMLGDHPMELPGPARVRGEVLVRPKVRVGRDGSFSALLDLAGSQLVATHFDGVDGVESDADALAQMGQMLFAAVGGELFEAMAGQLGEVGLELDADTAGVLTAVGCRAGAGSVKIQDGRMVVGLRALDGLDGHAATAGAPGPTLGIGLASGALSALTARLVQARLGVALPVELDVNARGRRVGTSLKNRRLVDSPRLPDLRASWRTTLRPRLVDGHIEIGLRESWLELPFVPDPVNQLSRWLGGAASRAPLSIRVPATADLPVRPDSEHRLTVSVSRLEVADTGIGLVVDAHF